MMEERRPVYESLAALTVPADDLVPDEVADELVKRLEDR
jgi:shikimate kinase